MIVLRTKMVELQGDLCAEVVYSGVSAMCICYVYNRHQEVHVQLFKLMEVVLF